MRVQIRCLLSTFDRRCYSSLANRSSRLIALKPTLTCPGGLAVSKVNNMAARAQTCHALSRGVAGWLHVSKITVRGGERGEAGLIDGGGRGTRSQAVKHRPGGGTGGALNLLIIGQGGGGRAPLNLLIIGRVVGRGATQPVNHRPGGGTGGHSTC